MDRLEKLLKTHPRPASTAGHEALVCIRAAAECALVCTACADACLSEPTVARLTDCIRLNLECGEICRLVARLLARPGRQDRESLERALDACSRACRACAEVCRRHDHEHCRICADTCAACAEACEAMVPALVP